jgi:ATP-binding cassette, subfamily B, bacterial PglK
MNIVFRGIKLLPSSSKKKIWIILLIQFIKFFLEIFSIGLIIPVIYILAKGENAFESILLKYDLLDFFLKNNLDLNNFIYLFLISIVLIFLIKFVFTIYASFYEQQWLEISNAKMASSLFAKYINDIDNISDRKNHNAIRNITSEISIFYKFFIKNLIVGFFEIIKLLSILGILYILDPIIIITGLLVIFFITFVILKSLKIKIENYGKKRSYNSGLLIKYVSEGLSSIKEIKLSNNSEFFLDKFKTYANDNASVQSKFYLLGVLPRQILELFAIILICSLIYYLSNLYSSSGADVLFILGVYVTALLRVMPSINMLYLSAQHILFGKSSLEILENEFRDSQISGTINKITNQDLIPKKIIDTENIELNNISFSYPKNSLSIFENASYKFTKGKIYCLVGESGSGKSTLINLIMGFIQPLKGTITFNGNRDIYDELFYWQKNISYLSQKVFLLNDSVKRNIAFAEYDEDIDLDRVQDSLKKAHFKDDLINTRDGVNTELGDDGVNLSGGQKQRIGIARNLYFNKKILILDEFTSSLDKKNEDLIFDSVAKEKKEKIIIVISHSENIIKRCDVVLKIEDKKIFKN